MEQEKRNAIKVFVTPLSAMVTSYNIGGKKAQKEVVMEGVPTKVHSLRLIHSDVDPWLFNVSCTTEGITFRSSKTGKYTIPEVSSSGWIPAHTVEQEPASGDYIGIPLLGLWIPITQVR